MFGSGTANYQTTLNTLVTLEDAFIAAYLIGIRDLSAASLRVLAGQIMGVESEHRVFGRVVATDLGLPVGHRPERRRPKASPGHSSPPTTSPMSAGSRRR